MMMIVFVIVFILIFIAFIRCPCGEPYNPVTGFSYKDGCDKMPVPENIRMSSKSPPFYNLNAVRPEFCAYRNFTFPPPMDYPPIQEPSPKFDIYQYWFNDAVLSHPQTTYLV